MQTSGEPVPGTTLPQVESLGTIVVCEDDEVTLELLVENLEADSYHALAAPTAADALRFCRYSQPDLLLLDLALPDGNGLDLLRTIRGSDGAAAEFDSGLPILVLSGRGAEQDRVRGLRAGADDYLTKPFHYPELLARIENVQRRRGSRRNGPIRVGPLSLDGATRCVRVAGREVSLANKEFELLRSAGLRAEPGVHQGGATARRLGLSDIGPHKDAGLSRQPAAPQARSRSGPIRGQLLGRRLPVGRGLVSAVGSGLALTGAILAGLPAIRSARRRRRLNEALHELRRPLQQLALRGPEGELSAWIEQAAAALAELESVVNARRSPLPPESVSLAELLDACGTRWSRSGRVGFQLDGSATRLLGDRRGLGAALDNLIANAIEHGRGPVLVRGTGAAASAVLSVENEPRSVPRSAPGRGPRRGQGLRIAARIAGRNGGRLERPRALPDGSVSARLLLPAVGESRSA